MRTERDVVRLQLLDGRVLRVGQDCATRACQHAARWHWAGGRSLIVENASPVEEKQASSTPVTRAPAHATMDVSSVR